MGVELVNRSFVNELFNVTERRAKNPMTLEEHKAAYRELVTSKPRDGSLRSIAEYMNGDELCLLPHYVQAERDVRRLGLHRVEEVIDLSKEELKAFVAYLIEESKDRQAQDEAKLNQAIRVGKKASADEAWLGSLAQLNRLQMLFSEKADFRVGCWFCKNKPIPMFDPFMFKMWWIRKLKRLFGIPHR
jgi:hypothetical protein